MFASKSGATLLAIAIRDRETATRSSDNDIARSSADAVVLTGMDRRFGLTGPGDKP
jgi:hypothetical protein